MRLAGFVLRRAAGVAPVLAALALGPASAISGTAGEPGWRVEAAFGAAHSLGSTLSLEQAGFPTLEINAEWESRNFESPPYYGLRVARQDARGAWAVRFVRSFPAGGFELWAGLGLVIAHPESTVRGRTKPETEGGAFGGGYYVTGPTGGLALGRRLSLGDRFALVPEVRFTLSRARVPIADGEASVPNASVHFLLGLELRF
jgi:hypothetical protein